MENILFLAESSTELGYLPRITLSGWPHLRIKFFSGSIFLPQLRKSFSLFLTFLYNLGPSYRYRIISHYFLVQPHSPV